MTNSADYYGIERRKTAMYYRKVVAEALGFLERGDTASAIEVLRGKIEKCPNCGDYLTYDHKCEVLNGPTGDRRERRAGG